MVDSNKIYCSLSKEGPKSIKHLTLRLVNLSNRLTRTHFGEEPMDLFLLVLNLNIFIPLFSVCEVRFP